MEAPSVTEAAPTRGGGALETTLAIVVCLAAMLGPVIYIQIRYDAFIAESGEIAEGAAGATLVLAVILRTISRTLLRTVVRASARAGLKASMKGALQTALRLASRLLFSSIFKTFLGDKFEEGGGSRPTEPAAIRRRNLKSLAAASALIYTSWVIVIGAGQAFAELQSEQEASAHFAERQAEMEVKMAALTAHIPPEVTAWEKGQALVERRVALNRARSRAASEEEVPARAMAERAVVDATIELADANAEFSSALALAKGRVMPPEPAPEATVLEPDPLLVYAPFPGPTTWGSALIWGGGLLAALPMWFIFFVQSAAARREGAPLYHETGPDGGLIQLYFAGAFSFMPLTSDVIVEGDAAQKGRVSLVGLLAPLAVAMALFGAWRATGQAALLLASDLFLIYPLVQCFPLSPLDGAQLWRWNRWIWLAVFIVVLGAFIFVGSEGLKNVI